MRSEDPDSEGVDVNDTLVPLGGETKPLTLTRSSAENAARTRATRPIEEDDDLGETIVSA